MSLKIDWWEIPPYIYKDESQTVRGIFPDILKKIVHECCDKDPASNEVNDPPTCVNLTYNQVASNDSEVVKKHIGLNGIYNGFSCLLSVSPVIIDVSTAGGAPSRICIFFCFP